ncbi:serine hydrolase domain-containing protein [Bernardetia sp. Wsw4-3y2]|uniref:serine hydrolase domain-containing protein n=1 Tax=Bernardetia sp. Wsw4-3y2 TaxID=3127471 RepID=UPI0030D2E7F1
MKSLFLILSLVIIISSCQDNPKQVAETEQKTTVSKINSLKPNINKELDSLHNLGVFNGFSVSIVDTSGILYNRGFGYADIKNKKEYTENTIINIASISKVFIGISLLKAQEMNLLDLDAPINDYLPFEVINPNFPDELITVRHLATHTSSIVDTDIYMKTCYVNRNNIAIDESLKEKYELYYQNPSNNWIPLEEYLAKILVKGNELYDTATYANRKPNEIYEYSNIGAALCALVIESVAKKPFHEFTKEHIFEPLGMSATSWLFEEVDSSNYSKLYFDNQELPYYTILSYPDGGLITSSTDLSKFLIDLIKGYDGNGKLLNKDNYEEFFKSQLKKENFKGKENFNVGFFLDKELAYNAIGHTGGDPGTNTLMYFDSEKKVGRIFIANTDSEKENSNDVFWGIWNVLEIK